MEHFNFLRLQRLLQYARDLIHDYLRIQWRDLLHEELSVESTSSFISDNPHGQLLIRNRLMKLQQEMIKRDASTWDITLLALFLRSKPFNVPGSAIKPITDVRNTLSHKPSPHMDTTEFDELWRKVSQALQFFHGFNEEEVETIRTAHVDEITGSSDASNTVSGLKQQGKDLFQQGKYEEASVVYSKALELPNVSTRDTGILYSNRSMCYLKMRTSFIHLAMKDALKCREYQPNWYKSHLRVGQAYMALGEPGKAVTEFERALVLDGNNQNVKNLKYAALRRCIRNNTKPFGLFTERSSPPIAGQQHVETGHEFFFGTHTVQRNVMKAIAEYRKGANMGNAEAMYNLATALMDEQNAFEEADKLLRKAASLSPKIDGTAFPRVGVVQSQYTLGSNYMNGIFVPQNVRTAMKWYERAVSNGEPFAANNLGLIYMDGHNGVDRDLKKAEDLFLLAYRNGETKAALNLIEVYMILRRSSEVKVWYDRAKSHGELPDRLDTKCEKFLKGYKGHGDALALLAEPLITEFCSTQNPICDEKELTKFDQQTLQSYAEKGSEYAAQLLQSKVAFDNAMHIIMRRLALGAASLNVGDFIEQLFTCYEIESSGIIAQFPEALVQLLIQCMEKDIHNQLHASNTDMKVRLVLGYCLGLCSPSAAHSLLCQSIKKYPQCAELYVLRGTQLCFQEDFESALRDFNTALDLSPGKYAVRYDRAVCLGLVQKPTKSRKLKLRQKTDVRRAYEDFIDAAPKDDRKVPAAYYAIAVSFIDGSNGVPKRDRAEFESYRNKGLKAEGLQLPYFLPYHQGSGKRGLQLFENFTNLKEKVTTSSEKPSPSKLKEMVASAMAGKLDGTDAVIKPLSRHRIGAVKKHRTMRVECDRLSACSVLWNFSTPAPLQQHKRSCVGLSPMFFRELDPARDYVAAGRVVTATIIEPPIQLTGIFMVVVDENDDAEFLVLYNLPGIFPANCSHFTIGTEIQIIEPYMRQSTDGTSMIRADSPSSVMCTGNQRHSMCRYCGKSDARRHCSRCKKASYCGRQCQVLDWKTLDHKLICKMTAPENAKAVLTVNPDDSIRMHGEDKAI